MSENNLENKSDNVKNYFKGPTNSPFNNSNIFSPNADTLQNTINVENNSLGENIIKINKPSTKNLNIETTNIQNQEKKDKENNEANEKIKNSTRKKEDEGNL